MKRRAVLFGFGAAALAAVGGVGLRFLTISEEDAIVDIIERKLNYLTLDPAGVRHFARDLAASHLLSSGKLRAFATVEPIYRRVPLLGKDFLTDKTRNREDRIVNLYLLSSDFFAFGADMNRTVGYAGYFDPLRACGNPFWRPAPTV